MRIGALLLICSSTNGCDWLSYTYVLQTNKICMTTVTGSYYVCNSQVNNVNYKSLAEVFLVRVTQHEIGRVDLMTAYT